MKLNLCRVLTQMACRGLQVVTALALLALTAQAVTFPGGLIETPTTAVTRPRLSLSQIQSFLPTRGAFTFPAPYNTQGVRLTNASDCAGNDCLWYVGYSYWRNMNNHVGSDTMYVFLGLNRSKGGGGPTLFSYNKLTDAVRNEGPLFDSNSALSWASAEGWYFSATQPSKLYLNDGPRMMRYDIFTKQLQTIYDVRAKYGADKTIWQMHSSDNDLVHSATLRDANGYLGCLIYHEDTATFQYFPKIGELDECNLDRSGRWAIGLENTQGASYGLDMRVFDLNSGSERIVLDQNGAVGHADMGYGYVVGSDNWDSYANAIKSWDFSQNPLSGKRVFHNNDWSVPAANHISHGNAKAGVPINQQYACGSNASSGDSAWANEVICFPLDGSYRVLVAAPVMTDMNSSVGGDSYAKEPKGNLDVTGQYFIWTSNVGGSRVDAFIAKLPTNLLGTGTDTTPPSVSISSPGSGATVSGTVTITANASDSVGVAAVQFMLDGVKLGSEDASAPYTIDWNSASTVAGVHTLTAIARDAAGNSSTSIAVLITVIGDSLPPAISNISIANVTATAANFSWMTSELSDTQIEYGTSTSYGSFSPLDTAALLTHTASLTGLSAGTSYHYRVRSRDLSGNLAVSADASFSTATVATPSSALDVVWTHQVNVTSTANAIMKTAGCDGCADAGAISLQQIAAGSGYVEFTVSETNTVRYLGLNSNNSGTSAAEIPFAFKLGSGYAEVREKDNYRSDTPVNTGDVLRISVQAGVIRYTKNGAVFYTSSTSASYPLRVDTALINAGATLAGVKVSGASTIQSVSWTNRINTSTNNLTLTKVSGCDGCEDAGAISMEQIAGGNGYFKFVVSETNRVRYVGLNSYSTGTGAAEIPFAFKLVAGYAEVRENDTYRATTPIVTGDVLRISVQAGQVKYLKNGSVIYSSNKVPTFPLKADTSILTLGSTIANATIASLP